MGKADEFGLAKKATSQNMVDRLHVESGVWTSEARGVSGWNGAARCSILHPPTQ